MAGKARSRSLPGPRDERGNLAALEAVFMGMLLVSSVAIVASLQSSPPPAFNPQRGTLDASVADLLDLLHLLPTEDAYDSEQDRVVGKSVVYNFTALERLIDQALPTGTECRLWIDNGLEDTLLYGPESRPARESVAASRLFHPKWAYAMVAPAFDTVFYNATLGTGSPLDVIGYAVSQGSLVKEAGVPVNVTLSTDRGTYARGTVLSVMEGPAASLGLRDQDGDLTLSYTDPSVPPSTSTLVYSYSNSGPLQTSASFTVPSGNANRLLEIAGNFTGTAAAGILTIADAAGVTTTYPITSVGAFDYTQAVTFPGTWYVNSTVVPVGDVLSPARSDINLTVVDTGYNTDWEVVVTEHADKPLPAGTKLTLRMPLGFVGAELTNTTQTGWTNIIAKSYSQDAKNGTTVTAELATPLQGTNRSFVVHGVRELSSDSLYTIEADLTGDAGASATFMVNKPTATTTQTNPIKRDMYLAMPKPMAPGKPANLGILFTYPNTAAVGTTETLKRLEIRATDGTKLFNAVQGLEGGGSWASLDGGAAIRWTGAVAVAPNGVGVVSVQVTPPAITTAFEPAHRLPVEFATGSKFMLKDQGDPYLFEGSFPPKGTGPGYQVPTMTGAVPQGQADLGVEWFARANRVQGNATYNVTSFPPLQLLEEGLRAGLAKSHLNVTKRSVKPGDTVTATVDFEALLKQINLTVSASSGSVQVVGWEVTVNIFDPAQPLETAVDRVPSFTAKFGDTDIQEDASRKAQWSFNLTGSTKMSSTVAKFDFKIPRGAFYGPYAIIAEGSFKVRDPVGAELAQVGRMMTVVDVNPDFGQSESALYWLSLECWLPDW